jgi:hypothetical protein
MEASTIGLPTIYLRRIDEMHLLYIQACENKALAFFRAKDKKTKFPEQGENKEVRIQKCERIVD